MPLDAGYIKLYRKVRNNSLWHDQPFDKAHAWIDLLLRTEYSETIDTKRGILIALKPGEIGCGLKQLADNWGWSRGKVSRFIHALEKAGMISLKTSYDRRTKNGHQNGHQNEHQNDKLTTIIYIENYEKYQITDIKTDRDMNEKRTSKRFTPYSTKNKEYIYMSDGDVKTSDFDQFWALYPKKVGKGNALRSWKKIKAGNGLFKKILSAVKQQSGSEQWQKEKGQFIPNPATWLNQGRWDDELTLTGVPIYQRRRLE